MMTMEGNFKVQTIIELFFHTIPQMVCQNMNNDKTEWTTLAKVCMLVTIVMFIKNLSLLTVYIIRRFIDNKDDPPMRPRTNGMNMNRVEIEAFAHIQSYLIDPHDDGADDEGNTTVH